MKKPVKNQPIHPGETLKKLYFEPLGISITDAASKLLITRSNLSAILNGNAAISSLMATKLAKALNTDPQYWLGLQASYDVWKIHKNKSKIIGRVGIIAKKK